MIASRPDNQTVEKMLAAVNNRHSAQQQQMTKQLAKMNQIYHQTEQFGTTITAQIKQITALQATLQSAVAPETPKAWHLAEVSFLLKLANRELHLSANCAAAAAALREADQILSEVGSVSYLPVRQQIATDLAALETLKVADMAGLSQKITLLGHKLKPVPDTQLLVDSAATDSATEDKTETTIPADTDNNHSAWQDYKDKAVKILSEAIIIRQLDQPLAEELSFTTREQAYQVLQLRLEALRLLALQQQDNAYQQQLQLPDISGSLRQLEKARIAEVSQ